MKRALVAAGLFLGTLLLGAGAYRRCFLGGETFEFCQYGEIGANLAAGRGFATRTYYPCTLAYFARRGVKIEGEGPVVDRFPLQAGLVALCEKALGRSDRAVAAANILAHAAWTAALYLGGLSLLGPWEALAAAALWALNPMMLVGFDLNGHPDVLFGLVFLLMNLAFFRWARSAGRTGAALTAGLLAGLCYLCRYSFALMLPPYLLAPLYLPGARGRWRELGLFLLGFLLLAASWSRFDASIMGGGSPPLLLWNLALGTKIGGFIPWCDYRVYSISDFLDLATAAALALKSPRLCAEFLRGLPRWWDALPLFPWAALFLWKSPPSRARLFLRFWTGLLLWTALCFSFLRGEDLGLMNGRYYLWYASALVFASASGMSWAAARRPRAAAAIWALGLGLPVLAWAWLAPGFRTRGDHASARRVGDWPELAELRAHGGSGWIVTNLSTQLTWYAGLKTITLPNSPDDVARIARDYPVDAVYLSFTRVGEWSNYARWRALAEDPAAVERFCRGLGFVVVRRGGEDLWLAKKKDS